MASRLDVDLGAPLTAREREVLALLAADMTRHEIAERMFISDRTVEAHIQHLLGKTGCRSSHGLCVWWMKEGAQGE